MTDFSFLDRNAEAALKEVQRLLERASYYKERQENAKTLENYVEALKAYANFVDLDEKAITVKMPMSMRSNPQNTALVYFRTLFDVAEMLAGILECYSDPPKQAFIYEKLQIISDQLANYEPYLDAQQLKQCETLRVVVEGGQGCIANNRGALDELKEKPIKELKDRKFADIRTALSKISAKELCPITLDSVGDCFIATAAYSTAMHPDLDTFRDFRDKKLLTNFIGKHLVDCYYSVGSSIARYVNTKPTLKKLLRQKLGQLANWMRSHKMD